MQDKEFFSKPSDSNVDKKRKLRSGEESLKEIYQEIREENNQPFSPPEKKKQTNKSSERRKTRSTEKASQEEQKDVVLEEMKSFSIKSSREAWTTEELKKLLTKFKVTIDKPSPNEFVKEFPSRSKKAIAHKLDFIDKKIRKSLNNGDILF